MSVASGFPSGAARRARLALAAALLPLLTACSWLSESSVNPVNWFSSSSTANKPTPLAEIKPTLAMTRVWGASVGNAGVYVFMPALVGNTVYAADADGYLAAFDAQGGKQQWRVRADSAGLSAGVGASEELAVVANVHGEILAFDNKGREKWRTQVTSEVLAPPLVTDREVLVRSSDNRVFAFAAADGKRLWVYQRAAPALVLRNAGAMVANAGQAYVGFPGGKLVGLALSNGNVRWEATVALSKGTTELERIADLSSVPIVSGREICAVAFQGRAGCFDLGNGQALWSRDVSSAVGLSLDSRFLFVSDEKSAVIALARGTGASLWKQEHLQYRTLSAPLSLGRAVIVGDYEGILHALSREDGAFIGRQSTDGSNIMAAPQAMSVGDKDAFLVQTRKGGLYVFSI